jgi:hypothetical protein
MCMCVTVYLDLCVPVWPSLCQAVLASVFVSVLVSLCACVCLCLCFVCVNVFISYKNTYNILLSAECIAMKRPKFVTREYIDLSDY